MLESIELLAVLSSAVYGILLACRNQFDVVGIFAIAFVLAFGGGTLRDLCLGRHPLFWIERDDYVAIVLAMAVAGAILPRLFGRLERFLVVPDALGLALYSIAGAGFALEAGTSMLIASVLGVVTGTFGGVAADVICNNVPSLFRPAPLYATCSFVGCWVYLALDRWGASPAAAALWAGFGVILLSRLAAVRWNLSLPNSSLDGGGGHGSSWSFPCVVGVAERSAHEFPVRARDCPFR